MNHTSGLVRYEFNERFTADLTASPDRVWKPQELVAYILDTQPPFAAGQGWDYSDTNYIVLGMIMEKVTGRTYYDLARERVLRPAGLRRRYRAMRASFVASRMATPARTTRSVDRTRCWSMAAW